MITSLDCLAVVLIVQQYLDQKMGKIHLSAASLAKAGEKHGNKQTLKVLSTLTSMCMWHTLWNHPNCLQKHLWGRDASGHGVNGCDLFWLFPAEVILAGGSVCVCDTFPLSQSYQNTFQSLPRTSYLWVQVCRCVHGFNLKYGKTEDCILLKKELFNNTSHHAINVDATL